MIFGDGVMEMMTMLLLEPLVEPHLCGSPTQRIQRFLHLWYQIRKYQVLQQLNEILIFQQQITKIDKKCKNILSFICSISKNKIEIIDKKIAKNVLVSLVQ